MTADAVSTAHINPTPFLRDGGIHINNKIVYLLLIVFVLGGFWLRAVDLSNESLGEDEWKKLQTVEDYRANGLTGANGEHPLLLKGILTISVSLSDRWNASSFVRDDPSLNIPVETALRLPVTIFGALSAILVFLIAAELFGADVGLIAAALFAFDPSAIGFARIAKEDVILTFFFMLANVFFLRSQRLAENGELKWIKWVWFAAVAYGAMMATKYMPHFMAISGAYYFTFQAIPATKWRMGPQRWFLFLVIVGVSFLIFNPTILLPETWRAITSFVSENRVGYKVESSYEYLGIIYRNKMSLWLYGVPWHFYYLFMAVKLPLITIAGFLVGIILMFRKKLGDGRWFIFWWCFFWFMPFSVLGGKFLRYFSFASPVVMIIAGVGFAWAARKIAALVSPEAYGITIRETIFALVLFVCAALPLFDAVRAAPHYRLYVNALGGGSEMAGTYFPHDEFFDARLGESARWIAEKAGNGVRIYSETPKLTEFHVRRNGRDDLVSLWLSDPSEHAKMRAGDIVIDARGRRYLSNDEMLRRLEAFSDPAATVYLGETPAVNVYQMNEGSITALQTP
jgi:predicted membrane-bound dolichyl-phosphate-mannose-protein mannosyltransferase